MMFIKAAPANTSLTPPKKKKERNQIVLKLNRVFSSSSYKHVFSHAI